jgi:hypothetical protein
VNHGAAGYSEPVLRKSRPLSPPSRVVGIPELLIIQNCRGTANRKSGVNALRGSPRSLQTSGASVRVQQAPTSRHTPRFTGSSRNPWNSFILGSRPLLRRHVSDGAYRTTGACQQKISGCRRHLRDTTLGERRKLCQTKIKDLGVTELGYKKICWLDVSMNDSLGVCCPKARRRFESRVPAIRRAELTCQKCGASTSRRLETPSQ